MVKVTREITPDADKIIEELNKALADEWLAYMQYSIAAEIVKGKMYHVASKELKDIAKEELEHIKELTKRIIQLGGTPLTDPKDFFEKTNCGYEVPTEDVRKAIEAAAKGEGCAIKVYNNIAKLTKDKDPVTYQLIIHILKEEEDHEQRFESILEVFEK